MIKINRILRFCNIETGKQLVILAVFIIFPISWSLAQQITVQPGDTLTKLAKQYDTTVEDIIRLNNLEETNVLIGDKLYVLPYEEIVVNQGDTLANIAVKYGVSVQALLEANNLTSTNIKASDTLKIPYTNQTLFHHEAAQQEIKNQSLDTKSEESLEAEKTTDILKERLAERLQDGREYVIVKPGDTLTRIAKNFSISIQDLMAFNRLSSTDLNVGDIIYISAPPAPPEELHTITVKIGDTLSDLAARYGTTPQLLMRANGLATPFIRTGQVLVLPSDALLTPLTDVAPQTYVVQQGDALYGIALKFGIPQERLIALNNLEGTTIYVGQELKLVGRGEELESLRITVAKGETLAIIARKYDVDIKELASANNISLESILSIGQKLIIPEHYVTSRSELHLDQGASEVRYITVERGDTLWELAKHHSTSVEAIVADNRLSSYGVNEGQILRVTPGLTLPAAAHPKPEPQAAPSVSTSTSSVSVEGEDTSSLTVESKPKESTSKLIWPLDGPITSRFGYRHLVISGRSYNVHTGIDIDGDTGDPIKAASSGKVVFSGWRAGYGYLVVVERLPYHYYYAHASKLMVSEGEQVTQGDIIAKVGATGAATGSHLHFEIRIDDKPKNPLDYLE